MTNWTLNEKIKERFGTQRDFAIAVRGYEADVIQVVRGRRTLAKEERERWANALGAEIKEIFGKDESHGEAQDGS